MSNRDIIKSYSAEGAISPCRFVKPGANDYGVLAAAGATDKIVGISMPLITVATGDTVDVMHDGIADLQLGTGGATRGDLLTSDATGNGVTAAPGAGTNNRVGAVALVTGVAGDIIPVLLTPGSVQG